MHTQNADFFVFRFYFSPPKFLHFKAMDFCQVVRKSTKQEARHVSTLQHFPDSCGQAKTMVLGIYYLLDTGQKST